TADAVHQCLDLLDGCRADLIAVFAADHVYRMDVRQMAEFHLERGADATVAAIPVALRQASGFGVIEADGCDRIRGFEEKPLAPRPMPDDPTRALASTGNYLFRPEVLRAALDAAAMRGETDFGHHVLPRLARSHRVLGYDFSRNRVPGLRAYEESAYWRDVGDSAAYAEAHWDLLGAQPRLRLDNPAWPIRSGNTAHAVAPLDAGDIRNTILGPNANAHGAVVRNCVLQRGANVGPGANLERCIVMDGVRIERGARFEGVILGRGGNRAQAARGAASAP
ncbi:MAG: sugar phosphate nucleotidyltransferase, partial [Betaproteobacteria bacterium]|nr:sugar phosphate nucleotidyltransferase [Betaproteobacteria bacterium]